MAALQARHGAVLRISAATIAWVMVMVITARPGLAQEAASLFYHDHFAVGTHRLRWYLHHGWTARGERPTPLFDPSTNADSATVDRMLTWLARDHSTRADLARLYLLAHQIHHADTANVQKGLLDRYTKIANSIVPQVPSAGDASVSKAATEFTLTDAQAALASLRRHLDMPWYIISGTFLGAVREGMFLAHDYDIDIGIHAENFDEPHLLALLRNAPDLTFVNHSPARHLTQDATGLWASHDWPALYRVLHASGIGIDIFVHHIDGDSRWHGSGKHRWSNSDFDLSPYRIAGLDVTGPANADRYLTENYGDWRTPVTQFNCSTGTPNVAFHRNLTAIAEFLRTIVQFPNGADAQVAILVLQQEGYLNAAQSRFALPWRENG